MKKAIILIFLFSVVKLYSQNDKVYYKANSLISGFFNSNNKLISSVSLGKNVEISHDEFFKIWIVRYDDSDGIRQATKLTFIQYDSFGNERAKDPYGSVYIVQNTINKDKGFIFCAEKVLDNGLTACVYADEVIKIQK